MFKDPNASWLLDFDVDTTVKSTDCAYDHIVLMGPNIQTAYSNPGVYDYQVEMNTDDIMFENEPITELISDHFPVEVTFA